MRRMAVAGSPAGLPVTALRVPDKAFVPAQIDPVYDRVYDNSQADRSDFRENHATSYTALGRVTGYFERATWGAVTFSYQGSVFGSPYEASNALREGLAATHVNTTPEGCTYIYHHSCSMLSFTYSSKGTSSGSSSAPANPSPTKDGSSNGSSTTPALSGDGGVYAVLQYNQCLVEVKAQAPAQIFDDSKETIVPAAWAILTEGNKAVSRACGSGGVAVAPNLDFHIIVTRVEPKSASAHTSIETPGLRSTQAGKAVNLVVYFAVTRNVRPDTALAHFTVAHGSTIQFKGGSLPVNLPTGPGVYRIAVHYTPHSTGKVSVLGRVTVGRQSQQMSTSIKVVR
jgi:hypothetical protein